MVTLVAGMDEAHSGPTCAWTSEGQGEEDHHLGAAEVRVRSTIEGFAVKGAVEGHPHESPAGWSLLHVCDPALGGHVKGYTLIVNHNGIPLGHGAESSSE